MSEETKIVSGVLRGDRRLPEEWKVLVFFGGAVYLSIAGSSFILVGNEDELIADK